MSSQKKEYRKSQILYSLWKNQDLSRSQIASEINLNLPTTSNLIQEMIDDGMLVDDGFADSTGGRKAQLLGLNPKFGGVIAIEFSSRGIFSTLADFKGDIISEESLRFSFQEGKDEIIDKILSAINRKTKIAKDSNLNILHIGICISGLIDVENGMSISFPHFDNWNNVPLKDIIEKHFKIKTSIINHIYSITLAENIYGNYRNYINSLYFHLGPGLAVGLKINGEVYKSHEYTEGEFGHTTVLENGPICYCGNYGCLESVASDYSLVEQILKARDQKVDSILFHNKGIGENITSQDIFNVASQDRLAENILEKAGKYIGTAMANIINIFSPQAIILGGTMAIPDSILIKSALTNLNKSVLLRIAKNLKIHFSSFGDKAGIKGAITFALERYFKSLN